MKDYTCSVTVHVRAENEREAKEMAWEVIDEDHRGLSMEISEAEE